MLTSVGMQRYGDVDVVVLLYGINNEVEYPNFGTKQPGHDSSQNVSVHVIGKNMAHMAHHVIASVANNLNISESQSDDT